MDEMKGNQGLVDLIAEAMEAMKDQPEALRQDMKLSSNDALAFERLEKFSELYPDVFADQIERWLKPTGEDGNFVKETLEFITGAGKSVYEKARHKRREKNKKEGSVRAKEKRLELDMPSFAGRRTFSGSSPLKRRDVEEKLKSLRNQLGKLRGKYKKAGMVNDEMENILDEQEKRIEKLERFVENLGEVIGQQDNGKITLQRSELVERFGKASVLLKGLKSPRQEIMEKEESGEGPLSRTPLPEQKDKGERLFSASGTTVGELDDFQRRLEGKFPFRHSRKTQALYEDIQFRITEFNAGTERPEKVFEKLVEGVRRFLNEIFEVYRKELAALRRQQLKYYAETARRVGGSPELLELLDGLAKAADKDDYYEYQVVVFDRIVQGTKGGIHFVEAIRQQEPGDPSRALVEAQKKFAEKWKLEMEENPGEVSAATHFKEEADKANDILKALGREVHRFHVGSSPVRPRKGVRPRSPRLKPLAKPGQDLRSWRVGEDGELSGNELSKVSPNSMQETATPLPGDEYFEKGQLGAGLINSEFALKRVRTAPGSEKTRDGGRGTDPASSPVEKITSDTKIWTPDLDIVSPIDVSFIENFRGWLNWNGFGIANGHSAFDFAAYLTSGDGAVLGLPENTPVRAVADGTVLQVLWPYKDPSRGYEGLINIGHGEITLTLGDSMLSSYTHLIPLVQQGQKVRKREIIGKLYKDPGSEKGRLVHLHLELGNAWSMTRLRGVDPALILFARENLPVCLPQGNAHFTISGRENTSIRIANFRNLRLDSASSPAGYRVISNIFEENLRKTSKCLRTFNPSRPLTLLLGGISRQITSMFFRVVSHIWKTGTVTIETYSVPLAVRISIFRRDFVGSQPILNAASPGMLVRVAPVSKAIVRNTGLPFNPFTAASMGIKFNLGLMGYSDMEGESRGVAFRKIILRIADKNRISGVVF
ncbi:MAG: peptidoglycan DD-metalloendopeptidase family protein, partial [Deltaproteobacteria bacterium]